MTTNTTNTNETILSIHPWEAAGLGKAPFKFLGIDHKVGPIRPIDPKTGQWDGCTEYGSPGQPMGTCQYCGQGIAFCCNVKSADGKFFIVGTDCIARISQEPKILKAATQRKTALQKEAKIARLQAKARETYPDLDTLLVSETIADLWTKSVVVSMAARFAASGSISLKQVEWLRRMERA